MAHVEIRLPCCDNDTLVSFLNGYIAPSNEGVAQLMRMVFRQQPFEGRLYRIEFDFLCFLKVNMLIRCFGGAESRIELRRCRPVCAGIFEER